MRAVIQRVRRAHVTVGAEVVGSIGSGLLVLLGIARTDIPADAQYLAGKILQLRIFDDEQGRMNRSVLDISGEVLVVSQFTLYGDIRKGRRPAYDAAAPADVARNLYDYFLGCVRNTAPIKVATGIFQAEMLVELVNDGPVTLICESQR